jgi:hypothetical protein
MSDQKKLPKIIRGVPTDHTGAGAVPPKGPAAPQSPVNVNKPKPPSNGK